VTFFSVKNFEKFQHYKDRAPPWIKLYNELLDDYEFGLLPDASKMHLIAIWLLASRSENKIPYDPEWVSRRVNATETVNLALLVDRGFILLDQPLHTSGQDASKPLAKCLSRERGEGETEERQNAANAASPSDEKQLYDLGKSILGANSGGFVKKLIAAKGGEIPLARAAMEVSRTKSDPREYLGAIIRGRGGGADDLRARGEAW
jgi:hypothetical protein